MLDQLPTPEVNPASPLHTTPDLPIPARQLPAPYRLPPGLRYPMPFYAGKPWVKLGDPIRLFEHLKRTFGPTSCYSFLGTWIVFTNEPQYVREILINQSSAFIKERTLQRMKILLGEGLITSDDPIHMRQRKIAAPAFHRQRIAAYAGQIADSAHTHSGQWQPGQTIDINDAMLRLSLEITARTLFDTAVTDEVRSINDETNTIMGLYNFLVAFPALERFIHLPIPGIVKFRRSRARLNAIVDRIIRERRKEMEAGRAETEPGRQEVETSHESTDAPTPPGNHAPDLATQYRDRGDLLSMLLASRYEDENSVATIEGMNNQQIRDEVLTIFLAGYETVANALTWTWFCLSQNPAAEARLHAELDQVLGPDPAPDATQEALSSRPKRSEVERPVSPTPATHRLPTLADLPNLRYTEQVFAESMRLYPPAWAMGRRSTRDVQLGPYLIPAGAHFFFSQYVMHRSEELFADPLRFDPDRHTPENKAVRDKFAYFPFGGGSRQCIGESFAWMEGILAIATIASRWRMRYTDPNPPVPQARITLRPRDPMHMRLEPRRPA